MAEHVYTYVNPTSERDLQRACDVLAHGGVLAYPTEINWAFGCDAADVKAIDRIRALKPTHPKEQPFSLMCDSIAMAAGVATIDSLAYRLLRKALPGPYTVLLPRNRSLPRQIKDKRPVVGIRVPASPLLLALVERYGKPLATTTVPPVRPYKDQPVEAPHFGYQVMEAFGHGFDLLLDLSEDVAGLETTIVDLADGAAVITRVGAGDPSLFEAGNGL